MKKVRVTRDMPFAKVGEEFETRNDVFLKISNPTGMTHHFGRKEVELLIKDGWLEWVKEEKSLEEKFQRTWYEPDKKSYQIESNVARLLSKIALRDFKEKFDKADKDWDCALYPNHVDYIRKAMFGDNS